MKKLVWIGLLTTDKSFFLLQKHLHNEKMINPQNDLLRKNYNHETLFKTRLDIVSSPFRFFKKKHAQPQIYFYRKNLAKRAKARAAVSR